MMKRQHILWLGLSLIIIIAIVALYVEQSREFIIALIMRIFLFVKKNILKLIVAFFLVKGKFILLLFLKKIALLSVTGLGKRYMVEKVVMGNIKMHVFDHLSDDIKRVMHHAKENFKNFPLVKKVITIFAFIGSLGFVGKFMGGMLAAKVFLAKIWSFLLAIFLKVGGAVIYFFTDYIWGSWFAPIVEVVIFSWLFSLLEKVPFLTKSMQKIYSFFIEIFDTIEYYLDKVFHHPMKHFLKWVVKKIQKLIHKFIGYKHLSMQKQLKEIRMLSPNAQKKLKKKRKDNKKEKTYNSIRERLMKKRKAKKKR